ncbi:MAG: hypothetical protein ACI91B_002458 [Planctomycetota bacterium]|jgi:hypothetical protein
MLFVVMLLVAVSGCLDAQQRREPIRGSAERLDGSPWAGATVHLLSRPLPNDARFGSPDEIVAVADQKGRFTVKLLAGRQYLAWGIEQLAEHRYRSSHAVERVIAGGRLVLHVHETRERTKLTFEGLDVWRPRGALVARLSSNTEPKIVITQPLTGDSWLLPPMPAREGTLQITCGGVPMYEWPRPVNLRKAEGHWKVRAGRKVRFRVLDESNKPVVGAKLSHCTIRGRDECYAGLTDAAGEIVVLMPIALRRLRWANYPLEVRAKGFAPVNNIVSVDIAADHDSAAGPSAVTLRLPKGAHHSVRMSRGNKPFAGTVACRARYASSGNVGGSVTSAEFTAAITPSENGAYQISRVPGTLAVVVAPTVALAVDGLGVPVHSMALLGTIASDEARPQLQWDLDALAPLVVAATLQGTPQHAARMALLVEHAEGFQVALSGLISDRRGRVAILIPRDQKLTVVVWTDEAVGVAHDLVVRPDGAACEVLLGAVPTLPGRVVTADGKPVPFATAQCGTSGSNRTSRAIAAAVNLVQAATAADGTFRMPLYPDVHYSVRGVLTPARLHYLDGEWTVGVDVPEELFLELRAR